MPAVRDARGVSAREKGDYSEESVLLAAFEETMSS